MSDRPIAALKEQLAIVKRNYETAMTAKLKYGINVPINIENEIVEAEKNIRMLEDALDEANRGGSPDFVSIGYSSLTSMYNLLYHRVQEIDQTQRSLETDVAKIREAVLTTPKRWVARLLVIGLVMLVWTLWVVSETREYFLAVPLWGLAISACLLVLSFLIWWLTNGGDDETGHHS